MMGERIGKTHYHLSILQKLSEMQQQTDTALLSVPPSTPINVWHHYHSLHQVCTSVLQSSKVLRIMTLFPFSMPTIIPSGTWKYNEHYTSPLLTLQPVTDICLQQLLHSFISRFSTRENRQRVTTPSLLPFQSRWKREMAKNLGNYKF
jgi:hypothetical protein